MSLDNDSAARRGPGRWAPDARTEERDASGDEYDDTEEWFSASFPSAGAAAAEQQDALTLPSPSSSKVAFSGRTLADDGDRSPVAIEGMGFDVDEYEIGLDPSGLSSTYDDQQLITSHEEGVDEVQPIESRCNWTDGIQPPAKADTTEQEEELVESFQPKVFKRRQRSESENPNGCGRCKSDLNGKLIVRCATCAFRRHLYCFSPPLRQHPAFQQHVTSKGTTVKIRPSADAIARWKCDDCQQKLCVNQAPEEKRRLDRSHLLTSTSNKCLRVTVAKANSMDRQRAEVSSPKRQPAANLVNERSGSADNALSPIQAKWVHNGQNEFDWYAFCADKMEKIRVQEETGKPDELVYYSKPFVDLKKTASSWMERVAWQKSFRRQRELVEAKTQLPPKRNVMHLLTEKELKLVEASLMRRQKDAKEEVALFDDAQTYHFDISVSRIRFLRQPRPSLAVPTFPTIFSEEIESDDEIAQVLREMMEIVALGAEDENVTQPDENSTISTQVASEKLISTQVAKLKRAAVVIQSAFLRWSHKAKQRAVIKLQLDQAIKMRMLRQMAAARSINLLRSCVLSIILFMRNLRNAQSKKQLLLALQEASEDSKVAVSAENDTERVLKLAEKRVQRFLLQRVRRYIKLKKLVMSRRILRWWKQKFFRWRWREVAFKTREHHREQASRAIQRAFKQFRVKKTFRELLEKHAVRKLKLFLQSWLMTRVIRKERGRVEIFIRATAIGVTGDELSSRPDATVDQILNALGMGLYHAGDFWNAACILERVLKLNQTTVTWEGRLALAYSHHMAWYSSYDSFNLTRAYETYCAALNEFFQQRTLARDALAEIDPFILQDTAVVMMQMENFNGSLRMLARLIELFTHHESFSLWLLLAAVQLQQRGEWAQSVEYLTYLQDIPPIPYLERDILCLCAIGLERQKKDPTSRTAGREAWKAAIRQWGLAQKELHALGGEKDTAWSQPSGRGMNRSRAAQSTLRKWEMLNEFAQRAVTQGHYLLACRLMLYMLELNTVDDENKANSDSEHSQQRATVWWNLADVFRHLGHLDLYVNATQRSHLCIETSDPPSDTIDSERVAKWLSEAETQLHSFQSDSEKLSTIDFVRKVHAQYSQM